MDNENELDDADDAHELAGAIEIYNPHTHCPDCGATPEP
jgi:hypothetical protein